MVVRMKASLYPCLLRHLPCLHQQCRMSKLLLQVSSAASWHECAGCPRSAMDETCSRPRGCRPSRLNVASRPGSDFGKGCCGDKCKPTSSSFGAWHCRARDNLACSD